ncbi:MAG: hypothetical protein Tsb009_00310 [Planctomycetaceae bacterium]
MQRIWRVLLSFVVTGFLLTFSARPASAQGLLWKLPEQETFSVLYYGTFTQKDISQGNTGAAPEPIVWHREIIVKSLKKAQGYYDGVQVNCRWIEISVRTGKFDEDIDTGPAGKRVYKVLVPESKVVGKTKDDDTIFVSMLPIARDKDGKVMGVKKIGNTSPKRMTAPVLHIYPILSLLHHYRTLTPAPAENAITVAGRQVSPDAYQKFTATRIIESPSRRTENTATLYFTDLVPTRLAKWEVKVVHKTKNSSQSRAQFRPTLEFSSSMTARTITQNNVQSQLPEPSEL